MHYCYIVMAGSYVKIGHTKNMRRRMRNIETGCPFKVTVLSLFPFDTEEGARLMEKELHEKFRFCRVRREWFDRDKVVKKLRQAGDYTAFRIMELPEDQRSHICSLLGVS